MAKQKGDSKTGGRKPGATNLITREIKAMIEEALHAAGGIEYLTKQATDNPAAFLALVGKILPLQVNHSGSITSYVVAAPPMIDDPRAWQQQHSPQLPLLS